MNCNDCEERMSDYLENAIAADERAVMDLHLSSCVACRDLCQGVAAVLRLAESLPPLEAPPWLAGRIVRNTPQIVRLTWLDLLAAGWRSISEPRSAMALFTATLVVGWMSSVAGFSPNVGGVVRNPAAIYYRVEGAVNRAYGEIVRNYYRSPFVNQLQYEINTRIGQLRENS